MTALLTLNLIKVNQSHFSDGHNIVGREELEVESELMEGFRDALLEEAVQLVELIEQVRENVEKRRIVKRKSLTKMMTMIFVDFAR